MSGSVPPRYGHRTAHVLIRDSHRDLRDADVATLGVRVNAVTVGG